MASASGVRPRRRGAPAAIVFPHDPDLRPERQPREFDFDFDFDVDFVPSPPSAVAVADAGGDSTRKMYGRPCRRGRRGVSEE
ncbi:MAG: hypothetical protein KY466_11325 [Gemmatimonadetes bacterium]|nr:hypothetical protein [Gemmatimonadota bacterium]